MHIGQRIREIRLSKMMTQADLAGDQITRNMLCSIERGAALPSLTTAIYLAGRLGVSVGFLLAEKNEEFSYRKMAEFPNVKAAFSGGDFAGALALLGAAFPSEIDDEMALLRTQAEYENGKILFSEGHFRRAAAAFDRAVEASAQTVYNTDSVRKHAAVYFRYLSEVSPTLSSEVLSEDEVARARATGEDFCEYRMALEALDNSRFKEVSLYLESNGESLFAMRVSALLLMREERYTEAQALLERLLNHSELSVGALLYEVFGDLELCCRKNDDYKKAYEFSESRIALLERLLEET